MRAGRYLLMLWLCFLARGAFYACSLPLWEGFDEYAHYARLEYLATEGREPGRDTPVPADVAFSLAHLPAHDVGLYYDAYWKLPEAARARGIPAVKAVIYEAQQPPLFYWLFVPLYRLLGAWTLAGRVVGLAAVAGLRAVGWLVELVRSPGAPSRTWLPTAWHGHWFAVSVVIGVAYVLVRNLLPVG